MTLLEKCVDWLLRTYLGRFRPTPLPTEDEIADLIDQYLGDDNSRVSGEIISHERNGYRYYITRSHVKKRRG
jgi:hypothetical protein